MVFSIMLYFIYFSFIFMSYCIIYIYTCIIVVICPLTKVAFISSLKKPGLLKAYSKVYVRNRNHIHRSEQFPACSNAKSFCKWLVNGVTIHIKTNRIVKERKRSPWLLTTYPSHGMILQASTLSCFLLGP